MVNRRIQQRTYIFLNPLSRVEKKTHAIGFVADLKSATNPITLGRVNTDIHQI